MNRVILYICAHAYSMYVCVQIQPANGRWAVHTSHASILYMVTIFPVCDNFTHTHTIIIYSRALSLQPPVIRLCDLHVRLDAAVKAGVQLLLLEKGPSPEMFRLQFVTKSEARL